MPPTDQWQLADGPAAFADLSLADALTVEAWIETKTYRPEALQPLVSQWRPGETFPAFAAYDAGTTGGLDCTGYYGALCDGRYVYFCPIRSHIARDTVHANILRLDTHGDFRDPASWEAYDARGTAGLDTVCYYGGACDGRYVYFVPRDDARTYHSRVLRYDMSRPFADPAAWDAHDAELAHSHQGVAFDGQYLYFCPGYASIPDQPLDENRLSGQVLRLDTRADFHEPAAYQTFDTRALGDGAVCFDGGAFDGRYIYFVPLTTGQVVRYDTRGAFAAAASWEVFDAAPLGMQMNVGAVFDGTFLYFCSYGHSLMIRYDTRRDFADASSWETCPLDVDGGYDGGFFDGRYVYFCPWTRGARADRKTYHCHFLRYDTTAPFADPSSWQTRDASATDGLHSVGYNAGAFDGRYFYAAPLFDGEGDKFHGRVLRCDALGTGGTFSLRYGEYGHNGGLCAAVPGPSFVVNTAQGARSIAAHRSLAPGRHYLAGTYDGRALKLYIDGELAAARAASGRLQHSDAPLTLGTLAGGSARFDGQISAARITAAALDEEVLAAAWRDGHQAQKPR